MQQPFDDAELREIQARMRKVGDMRREHDGAGAGGLSFSSSSSASAASAASAAAAGPAVVEMESVTSVMRGDVEMPYDGPPVALARSFYRFAVIGVSNYGWRPAANGPTIMILDGAVRREEALASMKRISEFLVQRFGTCMVCDVVELGVPMMIPYSPQRASTPGGLSELSLKESKIKALYANEVVRARRFYEYRAGASKSLDKRAMAEATEFKSFMAPEYAMASKRQSYYERTAYARGTTVEEVRAQRVEAAMKTMGVGRPVQMGLVLPQEKRLAVIRVWRDLTGDKLSSTWRSAGSPSGNEPLISIEEFFPENVDSATLDSFLNGLRHNCRADGVPIDVVKTGVPIGLYDMLESTMRACPTFIENTGSKTKDEFSQGHRTEVARADALKRRDGDGYRTVPKPSRAGMHEPETIENASVPGINMDAPVLAPDPAASSVDSGISSLPPHMRRAYVEEVVRRHRERLAAVPEAAAAAGAHSTERGPYA